MSSPQVKATLRMVLASFAAGAGAMMLVGIVGPIAVQGGLSVRDAMAAQVEANAPLVEPLDVAAIQAQLAEADRAMETMRASTADEMQRLEQLAR
ncbi:MAG: hypothetical protein AB7Q23_00040 [Hyphomonadaceae bacterium]